MNCKLSGSREIATNTGTNVCDDYAKWHIFHKETLSLANAILVFVVDMLGSSLLTFDYLLESFGFKTFKFGGSQLQNNI